MQAPSRSTVPPPTSKLVSAALRIPLFWKLLLAGLGVTGGTAVAVLWVAGWSSSRPGFGAVLAVLAGVAVGVSLVQATVLRVALAPLTELERVAERVRDGDRSVRAAPSAVADARLERLRTSINEMLDRLESLRLRQRSAARRAVGEEEEERDRIARELYGGPAQTLAGLLVRLRVLARTSPDTAPAIAHLENEVRSSLEGVRSLARRLRPPELDELGLRAALAAQARALAEGGRGDVGISGDVPDDLLEPVASLTLFRFVQRLMLTSDRPFDLVFDRVRDTLVAEICSVEAPVSGPAIDLDDWVERIAWAGGSLAHEPLPDGTERIRVTFPTRLDRRLNDAPGNRVASTTFPPRQEMHR